jgi:hypothetical protein
VKSSHDGWTNIRGQANEILSEAKDLYSRWPKLNKEEKRKIIETITEKIVVAEKDIEINLCYLPPSSELASSWQHNSSVASLGGFARGIPLPNGGDYGALKSVENNLKKMDCHSVYCYENNVRDRV